MARGHVGKKAAKASATNVSSEAPGSTDDVQAVGEVAPPFGRASSELQVLLKTLPQDHVYVVHGERTSSSMRLQAFLVPVFLNSIIIALLCWRTYYAVPAYLKQIATIFGYKTSWTVETESSSFSDLMGEVIYRTTLLMIDYAIYFGLGDWPKCFLLGDKYGRHTGAASWKLGVGFNQDRELIVRRGRKWDNGLFVDQKKRQKQGKEAGQLSSEEELEIHKKCTDALAKTYTSKTAFSLLDKDWDLDYKAMLDATALLDKGKMSWGILDHVAVLCWNGQWYAWYPHSLSAPSTTTSGPMKDAKLDRFKQILEAKGCDDVFYRWIEIVQYETAQPAGFTDNRKKEALLELHKLLADRGQNSQVLLQDLGGQAAIPGLDST